MKRRIFLAAVLAATTLSNVACAASPEVYTGLVEGVGAGGYDPVAYFSADGPKKGEEGISTEWKGAKWRFASEANRDAFKADPEKYAPQFGGYCAYAVSQGATAKGDPEVWTVVDGKLYLNLSTEVKALWSADIPGFITKAKANWPAVLN